MALENLVMLTSVAVCQTVEVDGSQELTPVSQAGWAP